MLAAVITACTPFPLVRDIAATYPGCLYYTKPEERIVALTIDDGPDSTTTAQILDLLRENKARATFFLISSRLAGNDSIVARTVREGHEIGNHMSRNEASISLSAKQFEQSLVDAGTILNRFGQLRWVRPGSGFNNAEMRETMRRHGYECALGSVYPFDPQFPFAWLATRSILATVRSGSVIVLHDSGYKGRNTVKVLATVLPELTKRGYRVVTLSDLVGGRGNQRPEPMRIAH